MNVLIIQIKTTAPEEHKTRLRLALCSAMKWAILNPEQTEQDKAHVLELVELLSSVSE